MKIVVEKNSIGSIQKLHYIAETRQEEKLLADLQRNFVKVNCITELADYTEQTLTGEKTGKALIVKRG